MEAAGGEGFFDEIDPARVRSPKIFQLHQAWESMRPAPGVLPGREQFDPALVGRLLPNILTLDILREDGAVRSCRIRLIGTAIRDAYGEDTRGEIIDRIPPHHRLAIDGGRPVWRVGPPTQAILKERVGSIENLILPLAADGRTPDVLVLLAIFFDHAGQEFRPYRRRPADAGTADVR